MVRADLAICNDKVKRGQSPFWQEWLGMHECTIEIRALAPFSEGVRALSIQSSSSDGNTNGSSPI